MREARSIFVCVAVMAAGLVAFAAAPVAATELGNRTFEDNTDFASFGVGGMRGSGSGTITVEGVSGTVSKALLYWNGPTDGTTSNAAVTFNETPITGTDIGTSDNNCWGFTDSRSYRADVTSLVSGNGTYNLTDFTKTDIDLGTVADANGASLIVFFDDGNEANNRDVTIVDGNDSNVDNVHDSTGWNSTINNVLYQSGAANLQLHVSDGQTYEDGAVDINGDPFLAQGQNFEGDTVPGTFSGNGEGVFGNLWDLKDYADISSFLSPGSNDLTLTSPYLNDCLSLVLALVDVPSPPVTDLSITKSDTAVGYGPDPVSSGNVVAYKVEVTNNGPDTATGITVNDYVGESDGTIVGASGTNWDCSIDGSATCTRAEGFDSLGSGATAEPIRIEVEAPGTSTPASIDDTATVSGNESDSNSDNNSDTESTTVSSSGTADHAAGFCSGATTCTVSTDPGTGATKTDPTVSIVTIPAAATADPQTITLSESTSTTLCGGGPCQGQVVEITSNPPLTFAGVTDPNHPAVLTMIFDKTVKQGSQVYIKKGSAAPKLVKNCTTTGIAIPHPCVSAKNILVGGGDRAFIILFLEGDPIIGKR